MPNETTPNDLGESAINASSDPYPDREQDPERAHSMALEGDSLRTEARDFRQKAQDAGELKADWEDAETREDKRGVVLEADKRLGTKDAGFYRDSIDSRDASEIGKDMFSLTEDDSKRIIEGKQRTYFNRAIAQAESAAQRADKDAKAREEWAGILHDHPVSDSYKAAHPEVNFTAEGLVLYSRFEEHQQRILKQHIESLRQSLSHFDDENWGSESLGFLLAPPRHEDDFEEEDDDETEPDEELNRLLDNDSTTIGELKELFKKRRQEQIQYLESEANSLAQVLEDVRSGRASEQSS